MSNAGPFQGMEQIRAGKAWLMVNEARSCIDEYASLAKSLPAYIHHNGLGQTLAFMSGKERKEYRLLGNQISLWVMARLENKDMSSFDPRSPKSNNSQDIISFIRTIMKEDTRYYRLATREALYFLNVLRNFATGLKNSKQKEET